MRYLIYAGREKNNAHNTHNKYANRGARKSNRKSSDRIRSHTPSPIINGQTLNTVKMTTLKHSQNDYTDSIIRQCWNYSE